MGVIVEVVCLQDLTLKVSGKYLHFWLSYMAFLIKLLTSERERKREEREREERERGKRERGKRQVILVVALAVGCD